MLLAVLTFGISLSQILIAREVLSAHTKFNIYLVVAGFSAIPLLLQLFGFVTEMVRAGRHGIKLVMQKFVFSILGDLYGAPASLLLKQCVHKPVGDYPGVSCAFRCLLYILHAIGRLVGGLAFGDAFSGQYQIRYRSTALWLDDHRKPWQGRVEPPEDISADAFEGSLAIRGLLLHYQFRPLQCPLEKEDSYRTTSNGPHYYRYKIFATGSSDIPGAKLYFEKFTKLSCSRESAIEFCKTMKTLNNDTFFVVGPVQRGNDQTLHCIDLRTIIESILIHNKKVNCSDRLNGAIYV